jgi:tetratricopeptide (TPR) repeat protein
MKPLIGFFALLLLALPLSAQNPDEHYVRIYQAIQEADRLSDAGQPRAAAAKYLEAQDALTKFRNIYPGWNERVINFRLSYVATKLAPLAAQMSAPAAPAASPSTSAAPTVVSSPAPTAVPAPTTPTPMPSVSSAAIVELENQVKALQGEVERLQADNRTLSAKLKEALSVQPAPMDPRELAKAEERIRQLLKENELFKTQLSSRTNAAPGPDLSARVKEQAELLATLRTENDVLKQQSAEWQRKYDALAAVANAPKTPAADPQQEVRIKSLTAENLALQKQIDLLKVARNTPPAAPSMPAEAQRELAALRARVETLEAKPSPYTKDELALFSKGPAVVATASVSDRPASPALNITVPPPAEGSVRKGARGIPVGAGNLVRQAQRAFSSGKYEEAEKLYQELVRQDANNVTSLADLASTQLELGRVADAEVNVRRALELDPDYDFSLYILGRILYQQGKIDDALTHLSRSAQLAPDNADNQNLLGIVLSEKGLRVPAEAALRKAIQLQPGHPTAHLNLAVVYATQQPPALALARWHYQKALAAGQPKNGDLEKLLNR